MPSYELPAARTLRVEPWPDPVIDVLGHDPRSWYVETYWLPILGPSTTWLLRRVADLLDTEPEGFELDLAEVAGGLGIGHRGGKHSPLARSVGRCVTFEMALPRGPGILAFRRHLPPLSRRQLMRLPLTLQQSHKRWTQAQLQSPTGHPHHPSQSQRSQSQRSQSQRSQSVALQQRALALAGSQQRARSRMGGRHLIPLPGQENVEG